MPETQVNSTAVGYKHAHSCLKAALSNRLPEEHTVSAALLAMPALDDANRSGRLLTFSQLAGINRES